MSDSTKTVQTVVSLTGRVPSSESGPTSSRLMPITSAALERKRPVPAAHLSFITKSRKGLRVRDVMSIDYPIVDSHANIQTLVDEHFLRMGRRCFFVSENGRIAGLVTPHEVREVERQRWPYKTVDEVMRPLDQLRTITLDTPVQKALEIMGSEDLNQLPVVENNEVRGILTRGHILQLLQTRAELRK